MSDALTPITTQQRLDAPLNYVLYSTTRQVPAEYPLPAIGDSMAAFLGTGNAYASNIVISVSERPKDGQKIVTIQHGGIYSEVTSSQRLDAPLNYVLYSTTVEVPAALERPAIGDTMAAVLGSGHALKDNRIISISERLKDGRRMLSIQHGGPYSEITSEQRLEAPLNYILYSTSIEIPNDLGFPAIGDTMEAILGNSHPLKNNQIITVSEHLKDARRMLSVQHGGSYGPIISDQRLSTPANHLLYSTSVEVPLALSLPLIGDTMTAVLGGSHPLKNTIIVDIDERFQGAKRMLSIRHTNIPTGEFTEYESFAYRFPPIYPNGSTFFPGGSQERNRTISARVVYEYDVASGSTFSGWRSAATIWNYSSVASGPFEVKSWIAEASAKFFTGDDGTNGTVGQFLAPAFIAQDTIHPALTINAPGSLHYDIAASSPDTATYASWVTARTEFIASRSITKWMGNIYMRRTVWIMAQ
jgi:hypothetical protein